MPEEMTTIVMIGIEVIIVMRDHQATGVSKAVIVAIKAAGVGTITMAADAAAGAVNNNHSNQAGIITMAADVAAGAVNNNQPETIIMEVAEAAKTVAEIASLPKIGAARVVILIARPGFNNCKEITKAARVKHRWLYYLH
jgi:hypothetical protein